MNGYSDGVMTEAHDTAFLRKRITGGIAAVEESFFHTMKADRSGLNRLLPLLEMYSSAACGNPALKKDAESLERKFRSMAERARYFSSHVFEGMSLGFDTYDDEDVPLTSETDEHKTVKITGVYPWNSYSPNKIEYRDGGIYSGKRFGRSDVIERAPVRMLQDGDMYSRTIRNFTFDVDPENGIYAIPFGYATYYRNADSAENANACYDFEFSDSDGAAFIVIRAICSIPKDTEIIVFRDPEKFSSKVVPGDFACKCAKSVYQPVKKFRFS